MLLAIAVGIIFFLMGYSVKFIIGPNLCPKERRYSQIFNTALGTNEFTDNGESAGTSYFVPSRVTVGPKTSDALEAIFDILIDHYVLSWYRTLSCDTGFILQVKLYLQYLCASIIHRIKRVFNVPLDVFLQAVITHVERILMQPKGTGMTLILEDSVLKSCGPHLHICMASRFSELSYVRALVNRLLPYVSYPPGLISPCDADLEKFLQTGSLERSLSPLKRRASQSTTMLNSLRLVQVPRSASSQTIPVRQRQHVPLGSNRAAYSFLVEILSTCVLLPAMDAIASPDLVNKFILYCFDSTEPQYSNVYSNEQISEVPVLNTYVEEWRKWISDKANQPPPTLQLDELLRNQEEFRPFMQYMKSVKSTVPLIAMFLISNINRRVLHDPLPPDICREIRSQLVHLLSLIRDSVNREPLQPSDSDELNNLSDESGHPRLFDLPSEFETFLVDFLAAPIEADALFRLVRSRLWKDAYRKAVESMGRYFLSMYVESPEYITHVFGTSALRPRSPSWPKGSPQLGSNRFENQLRSIFNTTTIEGRALASLNDDSHRPPVRLNKTLKASSYGSSLRSENSSSSAHWLVDGHHQLHSQLTSKQIDLTDWRVYIPGLSRPEISSGKRLIDQLTNQKQLSQEHIDRRPQYTSRPHDAFFRTKIADELHNLQNTSGHNAAPQLSPQFLYTVRTERVVHGLRQPITRVDRKYSEFYVLEQKLIEFHGNAITQALPPRKFGPRTFEFLESKREVFEEYLQYLLAQPFLRNSELLHSFLTSRISFSSNLLFELNLGRFVKSVPLRLIKERGQYLDQFLMGFYVSCNPQPILMEPVEIPVEPVFTIFSGSGVGTLGGIDALASPDHYSLRQCETKTESSYPREPHKPRVTAPASASVPTIQRYQATSGTSSVSRPHKRTWLDNRLRVKMFWNNAGYTAERRGDMFAKSCELMSVRPSSLTEFALYSFRPLLLHELNPSSSYVAIDCEERNADSCQANELPTQGTPEPLNPVEPWDISNSRWNEALLIGPAVAPVSEVSSPNHVSDLQITPPCEPEKSDPQPDPVVSNEQYTTVSISLEDIRAAFIGIYQLIAQQLRMRIRLFVMWILYIVHGNFSSRVDTWVFERIKVYLKQSLNDDNIAEALQTLKAALFYSSSPITEAEKFERKVAAQNALKQYIMKSHLSSLVDRNFLEEHLDKLFSCFQHPKWNKQLTYVLLDQVVHLLFPELMHNTVTESQETSS